MAKVIPSVESVEVGTEDKKYSSRGYRFYALFLLTGVYVFSYIDRKVLFILQEPIKVEFGLSDTQLGLLTGFAFMAFYVVFGIPIARWADRSVRRDIIALAIGVWSVMTVLCGMAQNYAQLLLARTGVAVGEAGCSPPAHSMISDIFPLSQRGTAMSIYTTGVYLGVLVGFITGGWISHYFGWRTAFVVVGLPGVLMAILIRLTLEEPRRGMADTLDSVDEAPSVKEVIGELWSLRSFRYMVLASSMSAFFANSMIGWMPPFLMRSHDLIISEVGTWLALILGIGGVIGALLGGYMADRFGKRDRRWYTLIPAVGMTIALPFTLATFLVADYRIALLAYCIPVVVSGMYAGPVIAMIHALVNVRSRAMSSAVFFLIQNMIGAGLGPLLVGMVSDYWAPEYGDDSLRYALVVSMTMGSLLAVTLYIMASRSLRQDLAHSESARAARIDVS